MNSATPRERRLALPALTLAAQVWGDDGKPPLLALHSWLDNAASFGLLAPRLTARWQLIALELPGHGHSDHLPAGTRYVYADYVRHVLAALDALGLTRCALLGHSLGAGIAALVAAARPQLVDRLLLIEGLGPLADDGTQTLQRFRAALAEPPAPPRLRTFHTVEQAVQARVLASGLRAELARPIIERGLVGVDGGWRWRSDPRLLEASPWRLAETQVRALLAGIAADTALLLAEPASPYLPSPSMRERAACVPRIAVEQLAGGHHLHLEQPEAVAAWLLAGSPAGR